MKSEKLMKPKYILSFLLFILSFSTAIYSQNNPNDILNRAVREQNAGKDVDAINSFTNYINLIQTNSEAYYKRALSYHKLNMLKAAESDLLKAIELNDKLSMAYNILGLISQNSGDTVKALDYFTQAIQIDPGFAEAFNNRGYLYGRLGKYNLALMDLNKAIELEQKVPGYYYNRGFLHVQTDDFKNALNDFTAAINLNPDYALAFLSRGMVHYQVGNYSDCIYDMNLAKKLNPSYSVEADKFIRAARGYLE